MEIVDPRQIGQEGGSPDPVLFDAGGAAAGNESQTLIDKLLDLGGGVVNETQPGGDPAAFERSAGGEASGNCVLNLSCTYSGLLLIFLVGTIAVMLLVHRIHRRRRRAVGSGNTSAADPGKDSALQTKVPAGLDFSRRSGREAAHDTSTSLVAGPSGPERSQLEAGGQAAEASRWGSSHRPQGGAGREPPRAGRAALASNPPASHSRQAETFERFQPSPSISDSPFSRPSVGGVQAAQASMERQPDRRRGGSPLDAEIATLVDRLELRAIRETTPPPTSIPKSAANLGHESRALPVPTQEAFCSDPGCQIVAGALVRVVAADLGGEWWCGQYGDVTAWFRTTPALSSQMDLRVGDAISVAGAKGDLWLAALRGTTCWLPMPSFHAHASHGGPVQMRNESWGRTPEAERGMERDGSRIDWEVYYEKARSEGRTTPVSNINQPM